MTKNSFENELQSDTIKVKKYFYALRPVLACQWIVDRQEMPPMEFVVLRQLIPNELQSEVDKLLKLKEQGDEKLFISRITSIHQFVEGAIKYCEENGKNIQEKQNSTEQLDVLFRKLFD